MNINYDRLDMQIDYLMHLQTVAKEKFGELVQACTVKAFDMKGYIGLVELKDGRVYNVKGEKDNPYIVKGTKENPITIACKWRKTTN